MGIRAKLNVLACVFLLIWMSACDYLVSEKNLNNNKPLLIKEDISYNVCNDSSVIISSAIPEVVRKFVIDSLPEWEFPLLSKFAFYDSCILISPFLRKNKHQPPFCISVDFNRDERTDYIIQVLRQNVLNANTADSAVEGRLIVLQNTKIGLKTIYSKQTNFKTPFF